MSNRASRMSKVITAVGLLLLMTCSLTLPAWAFGAEVLVTAEDSPAIRGFVDALAARRPRDEVAFRPLADMPAAAELAADLRLVTLGKPALKWRLDSHRGPPTLALLVSRVQAHALLDKRIPANVSFLWSDPPPARQLRLIRLVLPSAQRIGLPYDDQSAFLLPEVKAAAERQGLTVVPQAWTDPRDTETLNQLLRSTDALLGLDDRELYNPSTAKTLLLTSYGQNRPLFGPSAAFVRAGSLASTYSDQNDWLQVLDDLLDRRPANWPLALYPAHFKVVGNHQVARSLGIHLPEDEVLAERLAAGEAR